ncbi:MAG TPA: rod shape-determining protein MreD [Candidatus Saccharimonadales bacterium]|nr:rod shape-determining protein MreD [Candidatus Saccharimonadales bacterium]
MRALNLSYTSREQVEVYRFSWPVSVGLPLLLMALQAFLPVRLHYFRVFDFGLLLTIFFAVSRRSQLSGTLTGAAIGMLQDGLTHTPFGVFGIAKTLVGYGASSIGIRIDVENPGSRFLLAFFFYAVHQAVFVAVERELMGQSIHVNLGHEAGAALANSVMAVFLFALLNRFKIRD